jgi:hypothetical protein
MFINGNDHCKMASNSNKGLFFFSSVCDMSKHLLGLFESEGLVKYFILVDVYKNPKVPPQITKTPTLVIKNIPTPFVGPEAFDWLARVKQWKMQTLMTQANQQIMGAAATEKGELFGFSSAEMNSVSDNFSCFNRDIDKEYTEAMPQNYCAVDTFANSSLIWAAPEVDSTKIESETEAKKKSIIEQKRIERERAEQDYLIKSRTDAISKDIQTKLDAERTRYQQEQSTKFKNHPANPTKSQQPRKFAPNLRR